MTETGPPDLLAELQGRVAKRREDDVEEEDEDVVEDDEAPLGHEAFIGAFLGPRVFASTMKKSSTYKGTKKKRKRTLDELNSLIPNKQSPVWQWLQGKGHVEDETLENLTAAIKHIKATYGGEDSEWDAKSTYIKLGEVDGEIVLRVKSKKDAMPPRLTYHADYILTDTDEEDGVKLPKRKMGQGMEFEEFSLVALTPKAVEDWFNHESFAAFREATGGKGVHVRLQAKLEQNRSEHALVLDKAIVRDIKNWGDTVNERIASRVQGHLDTLKSQPKVLLDSHIEERIEVLDAILEELDEAKISAEYEEGIYEIFERHLVTKDFRKAWIVKTVFKTTLAVLKTATACIKLGVSMGGDASAWISLVMAIKDIAMIIKDILMTEAKARAALLEAIVAMKLVYDDKKTTTKILEWLKSKKGLSAKDKVLEARSRYLAALGKLQKQLRDLAKAIDKLDRKLAGLTVQQAGLGRDFLTQANELKRKYKPASEEFKGKYDFVKLQVDASLKGMDVPTEYTTTLGRIENTLRGKGTKKVTFTDLKDLATDGKALYSGVKGFVDAIGTI